MTAIAKDEPITEKGETGAEQLPDGGERNLLMKIVRPANGAERWAAVFLWWTLALALCGPQHGLSLPFYPLGLACVMAAVGQLPLLSNCGVGDWTGELLDKFLLRPSYMLFPWAIYGILTTALLVFANSGGRRWRIMALTLVVLLVLNTAGCDIIWISEASIED
jgi:hypothetical protein